MDVRRSTFATIIFCLVACSSGCHLENAEQKGDRETKEGRFESAIYWYEAALGQGDRSAVHWKMAEIFASKLHDPASAVYHYRRILALHATGPRADASRAALHRLEGGSPTTEGGHSRVGGAVKLLPPEQAAAEAEKAAKAKVRTYLVQSGDSLVSISRKFYQTTARWKDILDANQNQLSNPDELRPGQTIIIP